MEEQKMVTNFIVEKLSKLYPKEKIIPSNTYTRQAGNLVHLCADFEFLIKDVSLLSLINSLHPTPAVSGVPVKKSMSFINHNETHDRKFYAGFLGPIYKKNAHLFVNLRCGKITHYNITLYVGGGITANSNSELEWEESERKAETLLNVI